MKMREGIANMLVKSLGWFALGLGALELAVPRLVARLVGAKPSGRLDRAFRVLGAREAVSGLGMLGKRRLPGWAGMRVAGDAADLGLLVRSVIESRTERSPYRKDQARRRTRLGLALGAVAGISVLDVLGLRHVLRRRGGKGATGRPGLTASTTIERSVGEVYRFLRDVKNFPRFVSFLRDVTAINEKRSYWVASFPGKREVRWEATLEADEPERRIAWQMNSRLLDTLELRLEPAPGGRGTEVHVTISARTTRFPDAAARWLRRVPERLMMSELRRMKQVIELGEVSQSDASIFQGRHPARPERAPVLR